ncbi:MAG: glycoside hydrolase, partial [Thiohalorhabdaceae bacterium]
MADWLEEEPAAMMYMDDQFIADILTWYHLAWMGETVRREDPRIRGLQEKGAGFTIEDRRHLLSIIGELLETLPERYKGLANEGRIELAMTPYAHPIGPLLQDFASARESLPEIPLPESGDYPGGEDRLRWHIERGQAVFKNYFGFSPRGCWPAEGAVSEPTLRLLSEYGFEWAATGEGVLGQSLGEAYDRYGHDAGASLCHPYRLDEGGTACFFRDDELSDLIGFQYSGWHAEDAVGDLVDVDAGLLAGG